MIVVGCPVYERGWVLESWFDGVAHLGDVTFCFVVTPGEDDTEDIIRRRATHYEIAYVTEGHHSTARDWANGARIATLAHCRNVLDDLVRQLDPDVFVSVDSDIILPANASDLLAPLDRYDVVAPLVFLGPSTITNAFADNRVHPLRRLQPQRGVAKADVVCAAKAVTRDVLANRSVSYAQHRHGEELLWCRAVRDSGFDIGWNGDVRCKHVMSREALDRADQRIGW